jgi:hypothetical protein
MLLSDDDTLSTMFQVQCMRSLFNGEFFSQLDHSKITSNAHKIFNNNITSEYLLTAFSQFIQQGLRNM